MEQRRAHCSAALTRPFRTVLIDLQCSTRCLVCSSPRRCWPPLCRVFIAMEKKPCIRHHLISGWRAPSVLNYSPCYRGFLRHSRFTLLNRGCLTSGHRSGIVFAAAGGDSFWPPDCVSCLPPRCDRPPARTLQVQHLLIFPSRRCE